MTVKRGRRNKDKALFVVTQTCVLVLIHSRKAEVRVKVTTIKNMLTLKAELVAENHTIFFFKKAEKLWFHHYT